MTENKIMFIGFLKVLIPLIGGYLYSMAGRDDDGQWWYKKAIRRFVSPFFVIGASIAINLGFGLCDKITLYLICCGLAYVAFAVGLSCGYGSSDHWTKIFKRTKVALIFTIGYAVMSIYTGYYALGVLTIITSVLTSVFLGVFNNLQAPNEEQMIGSTYYLYFPFFV